MDRYYFVPKIIEESDKTKRTKEKNKKDTNERQEIQQRIRDLYELGFPQEEALIKIISEFEDSKYRGFFKGWIENAYMQMAKKGYKKLNNDYKSER